MRDDQIFLCFDCGTKNRIRSGVPGVARCGNCGAALGVPQAEQHPVPGSSERADEVRQEKGKTDQQKSGCSVLLGALVIFSVTCSLMFYYEYITETGKRHAAERPLAAAQTSSVSEMEQAYAPFIRPVEKPQPVLFPVHQAAGIIYNNTGRRLLAPFEIVTKPGQDYYVKLVELPRDLDAVGIYVRGGQRVDVLVPLGSYELRSASGETWYGLKDRFGPNTAYAKAWEPLHFTKERGGYSGYTIELIPQRGGNMRTDDIEPSEF